jgi:hypothetical protein
MPHQCTTCGHTFADGSKEMLSGCPDCGGNTFQFRPARSTAENEAPPESEPEADATPPEPDASRTAQTVGRAATRVRDFVAGDTDTDEGTPDPQAPWPDDDGPAPADDHDSEIIDADARRDPEESAEDLAQASARGDIVTADEVAAGGVSDASAGSDGDAPEDAPAPTDGRVVSEPSGETPDIEELRRQLNDQFESIKIVEPGEYELNLMELYNREEYIIALQENGRYVIQVPENWLGDRDGPRNR